MQSGAASIPAKIPASQIVDLRIYCRNIYILVSLVILLTNLSAVIFQSSNRLPKKIQHLERSGVARQENAEEMWAIQRKQ